MSLATVDTILYRIRHATVASSIAVFVNDGPDHPRCLNAVFTGTVETRRWLARGFPKLIGVYHGNMDLALIRTELRLETSGF